MINFVYIEDNKFNQMLMQNIITNHKIDVKNNAHNLLQYIKNYDILLLDWNINSINGLDVIKILHKNNITIPIIVITADTNPVVLKIIHSYKLDYFNKPINIKEFRQYFENKFKIKL